MERLNLADVAAIDTGKPKKKTRWDRINWRLKQLNAIKSDLSSWESDFISSVTFQFNQDGKLSDPQYRTVLKIWQTAHEAGYVKLPKGEF